MNYQQDIGKPSKKPLVLLQLTSKSLGPGSALCCLLTPLDANPEPTSTLETRPSISQASQHYAISSQKKIQNSNECLVCCKLIFSKAFDTRRLQIEIENLELCHKSDYKLPKLRPWRWQDPTQLQCPHLLRQHMRQDSPPRLHPTLEILCAPRP